MRTLTRLVTTSALRTFRRCPREYQYSYVDGYRPLRDADPLRFGTLIHLGLEAWWKAPTPDERLDAALAALVGADDAFELARATVAIYGYDAKWCGEPLTALPGGVEAQFRAPLVNPTTGRPSRTFDLGGKLDVLVLDGRDNREKLVEHKWTSKEIGPGSAYWKRLTLDTQISNYHVGAPALGHPVASCIYDVLGKPLLRPSAVPIVEDGCKVVLDANGVRVRTKQGKWRETGDAAQGYVLQTRPETPEEFQARLIDHVAENPDRYYQRGEVVRLEHELADAAYDTWITARLIREAEVAQRFPRHTDACERGQGFCPFWSACSGEASLDDPQQYRRTQNVHEELTPDAA